PALALEYDSGGGVSEVGLGWRLGGVPSIRRRTTEGLPTFTEADAFEAVGLGLPCDLVPVEGGFFRPEHEAGSFVRVQRSDDGSLWEAHTKGGVTFRFGGDGFTEQEELNAATGDATSDATRRVVTYQLREQLERHGRHVAYEWDTEEGHAHLTSVTWNDFSADVRQRIQLVYEERPDAHELYGSGIRKVLSRRLARVDVTLGGQLVRRYELSYTDAPLPQLEAVTMLGTDGATALPTLRFEYTEPNFSAETSLVTMTTPPGRSPADPGVELADLDGDGLPDLLVTEAGSYRSSLNHDGVSWRSARDWPAAESPSVSLAAEGTQLADPHADGAPDLVLARRTHALRSLPGGIERFDAADPLATVPSFHFEDPELRLVDLDGDRRMDVLLTSPAGLVVSYNRGGHDWSTPETLGVLDERHELRFSD